MTSDGLKLPFYARVTIFFIGAIALFAILYIAKNIIVPVVFATIIAIVLSPLVDFLVRIRINRVVAIAITLLLTFLVIAAFGSLLISQVNRFADSWPLLVDKFTAIINQTINEAADYFNKDPQKIHAWITKTGAEIINISTAAIGQTLVIAGSILVVLFLLPVYVFLILFYQPLLLEFIWKLFGKDNHSQVKEIVTQIKTVIQHYLTGLLIEAVIVAILDTLALLILGIEYALIIGILGALLNIIPYIGGLVAVALPMIVAIVTKSTPLYALYVLIAYYIIQLIDNNYIVPIIVASKVKINALFSIIVVIAGNALWGIPGMFLSIPVLAIVKLICDNIESLKPWGFLLGDTIPPLIKIDSIIKKIKSKTK
ncbi:MAG: AI-2E family transporter [Bacteroidales bacterium]|nr:AI-2E family transporter [Bacteroidales bacterium]